MITKGEYWDMLCRMEEIETDEFFGIVDKSDIETREEVHFLTECIRQAEEQMLLPEWKF